AAEPRTGPAPLPPGQGTRPGRQPEAYRQGGQAKTCAGRGGEDGGPAPRHAPGGPGQITTPTGQRRLRARGALTGPTPPDPPPPPGRGRPKRLPAPHHRPPPPRQTRRPARRNLAHRGRRSPPPLVLQRRNWRDLRRCRAFRWVWASNVTLLS